MTICEKCGTEREFIAEVCEHCGFEPHSMRELATAALLTSQFEAGEAFYGTEPLQLQKYAEQIRAGDRPSLDEEELQRHEATVTAFVQVTPWHIADLLFRTFLPAILMLLVIGAILFLLRWLRG